jgi:hypothetical protein
MSGAVAEYLVAGAGRREGARQSAAARVRKGIDGLYQDSDYTNDSIFRDGRQQKRYGNGALAIYAELSSAP